VTRSGWLWLGRAEAVALVAVGLFALLFHARLPGRLPEEADHRAAGEALAREARPGDVLLLHPWWAERARLFAPDGLPVVGYLGSEGDPLEAHPRIWVLSQPELPGSGAGRFWEAFRRGGREPLGEERRFGTLRLTLHRNGRYRPTLFSAAEALESGRARVYLEAPQGGRRECPGDARGFRCPGGAARAAVEWHEVLFQPRRCLFMQPPGGAERLVVELPELPEGDRLSLQAGFIWDRGWFHGPTLTPATVAVEDAGGAALAVLQVPAGEEGLQRAEAPGRSGPVRLTIQAVSAELRETCVDLFVQGKAAGELAR
jgi:hypothetical protein